MINSCIIDSLRGTYQLRNHKEEILWKCIATITYLQQITVSQQKAKFAYHGTDKSGYYRLTA